MTLSLDDRLAITDLVNRHGHLTDAGDFDAMPDLFAADVVLDVSDLGVGVVTGLDDIRATALALGDANPLAHHVTNVVVTEDRDGAVRARSKGLGVRADGTVGSVVYEDVLTRRPEGWRISHRTIRARRTPLTA